MKSMAAVVFENVPVEHQPYVQVACDVFAALVSAAPAVDAEPVRHGELVSTGFDEIYCEWGDCTVCGSDNRINAKFCNNCGAEIGGIVTK